MKNRNWFWGLFFLAAAIFVIASQTGSFGQIGVLSIITTTLLTTLIIHSIISRNFFGIFIPLAFLYMIFREPLNFIVLSPWILIFAAIMASIGFSIIFRSHPKNFIHMHHDCDGTDKFNNNVEGMDDNNPYSKVSFGSSSKYLHADCLKSGQFIVSFGALEVFFDQAQLSPEGAEIFLDCSFGEITLHIPRNWQVQDNVRVSLGELANKKHYGQLTEDAPRLTLTGNVQLGSVEIKYI